MKYTKPPLKDSVLHLAARRKDNDLVKLFIEAGAGVDVKNVRKHFCSNYSTAVVACTTGLPLDGFDRHFQAPVHIPLMNDDATSITFPLKFFCGTLGIKPGTAGREASILPLCYAAPHVKALVFDGVVAALGPGP